MKRSYLFVAYLALLLSLPGAALAQGGNPHSSSCGTDVPLIVTFRDFVGNPSSVGDKLYGNQSAYTDGVGNVNAEFQVDNCTFDFIFNLNTTPHKIYLDARDVNKIANGVVSSPNQIISSKFFNFDRVGHVPLTPTTPVGTFYDPDSEFGKFCDNMNADNRYNVQYGGCQQDLITGQWYVRRALTTGFSSSNGEHPLRFQKPPEGQTFTSAEIN